MNYIKRNVDIYRKTEEVHINDERKLEFVRFLGHKYDMPGSSQWKINTDKENPC